MKEKMTLTQGCFLVIVGLMIASPVMMVTIAYTLTQAYTWFWVDNDFNMRFALGIVIVVCAIRPLIISSNSKVESVSDAWGALLAAVIQPFMVLLIAYVLHLII